jgi:hypothetical protein
MKIEHQISEYNCEVISNQDNKAIIKVKDNFSDYQPADFNVHFAIQTLLACNILEKISDGHYNVYKSQYLYEKAIRLPDIIITGKLADDYTFFSEQQEKLKAWVYNKTATIQEIKEVIESISPFFEAKKIAECQHDDHKEHSRNLDSLISKHKNEILDQICKENNIQNLRTIDFKRKKNNQNESVFDYSLPAKLSLGTVTFDEKEYKKLMDVVNHIIQKFHIQPIIDKNDENYYLVEVEYQNIQPKPKKTKLPPIHFESLEGKEILADDYFYALTKLGWKYDLEESDLFYMLSKTFWTKGIKVFLVLKDHCCVPPLNQEEAIIESIDFFGFDKKVFKEKNIETEFEKDHKNNHDSEFESFDDYIRYFSEQYPFYIQHADFNTGLGSDNFDTLQKLALTDVPINIQKEIWTDLNSF